MSYKQIPEFAPPPQREDFKTESEYQLAYNKWNKAFKNFLKEYGKN